MPLSRRAGFGLALIVVVLVGAVLAAVLAGQAYFASGSTHLVLRSARAEVARTLAESAIEEALEVVTVDANGAGTEAYRKFREPAPAGFTLEVSMKRLEAFGRELLRLPLYQKPAPVVKASVRFQKQLDLNASKFHDQRFGTLELTATVPYQLDRSTEQRTVTRWYEFKVEHVTLPFPFDKMPLYIHDAKQIVNVNALADVTKPPEASLLIQEAALWVLYANTEFQQELDDVKSFIESADREPDSAGARAAKPKLVAARASLERALAKISSVKARFQGTLEPIEQGKIADQPPFLLGFPLTIFAKAEQTPATLDLNPYNLPVLNRILLDERHRTELEKAQAGSDFREALSDTGNQISGIAAAGRTNLAGNASAFADAIERSLESAANVLDTYARYEKQFTLRGGDAELKRMHLFLENIDARQWTGAPTAGGAGDPVVLPGHAHFAIPKARCADAADLTKAVGEILDRYGPPFQGTIHVDNAGGAPLRLEPAADRRWGSFDGRLTIIATGPCTVRDVARAHRDQGLINVICYDTLTIGGTVEASLVAFKRLVRAGGSATIIGHLVLDRPSHELTVDKDVEGLLANLTIKPDALQPTNFEPGTIKGDRVAVLFAPVPIYSRSPREDPK